MDQSNQSQIEQDPYSLTDEDLRLILREEVKDDQQEQQDKEQEQQTPIRPHSYHVESEVNS